MVRGAPKLLRNQRLRNQRSCRH
ncbi:MAG: hypothetical protein K0R53_2281, partial [Burkholderiales bacterium]|nr:hypothetical protein [Burkholderiales bacterium]